MFEPYVPRGPVEKTFSILGRIYHNAVRLLRRHHGNAVIGLLLNIVQSLIMVAVFYIMFEILGLRGTAIRGDYILYIMSGVFSYMTHVKTMGAVSGAENSTSPMMNHLPMNTMVSIGGAALSALYMQILSMLVILYFYHVIIHPISIEAPQGAFAMLMLSWASGVAVGLCFMAAKPWQPDLVGVLAMIYMRANMIASGKMFVANRLNEKMLSIFDWNPLFHIIDQARGFLFINYDPKFTSISYPVRVTAALWLIGLMAEFYTRRHASLSWGARR